MELVKRGRYEVNEVDGIKCERCGCTHFRFEQEAMLGAFPFYGYTCLKCGNLVFMDKDAMIDTPNYVKVCKDFKVEHQSNIKLDKPK